MHAVLADTALFCEHARLYTEKRKSAGVKMKRIGGDARGQMTERMEEKVNEREKKKGKKKKKKKKRKKNKTGR